MKPLLARHAELVSASIGAARSSWTLTRKGGVAKQVQGDHRARGRLFGITVFLAAMVVSSSAQACGRYGPNVERREARQQRDYLAYADRIVRGRWQEISRDEQGWIKGAVIVDRGLEGSRIELSFQYEINCGFPGFPEKDDHGMFYLRASNISPGDYQKEEVEYDLLHFKSDRKKS